MLGPLLELLALRHLFDLGFERLQIKGFLLENYIGRAKRGKVVAQHAGLHSPTLAYHGHEFL